MELKVGYQICSNCVMDTTDEGIRFGEDGMCDHCLNFYTRIKPSFHPDGKGEELIMRMADDIRRRGKNKKYDCIIGFSGGVDSSYLAYLAKKVLNLRPLLYVVDTGWNLPTTEKNIEAVSQKLELDVVTDHINWDEMSNLQLSYLKSQIRGQDTPQDHAIFASLYNYSIKNDFKYVLTGANIATECILPGGGMNGGNDVVLLKDIQRRFGSVPLKDFPLCSIFRYRICYPYLRGMKRIAPLNYFPFNPDQVESFLRDEFGWIGYENKHYDNLFTRWYEGYYLVNKFNYDKRRTYFSSLILSGHMTREEALKKLSKPPYSKEQSDEDTKKIAERLGISKEELIDIIKMPSRGISCYKNQARIIKVAKNVATLVGIEKRFINRSSNKDKEV